MFACDKNDHNDKSLIIKLNVKSGNASFNAEQNAVISMKLRFYKVRR